jgi:amidase
VGTDIGGSIRIPSAFGGIYGLKPSFGRFATYGCRSGMPGQEAVRSINGPMSSSLDACELWAKTVVDSKPWQRDPNMVPIPWREIDLPEKLCFGIIMDNGLCRPTPPVIRALNETKAALEAAGHRVVEWVPHRAGDSQSLLERFFIGDGGAKISSSIAAGNEPWPVGLQTYEKAAAASRANPPTVGDLWTLQAERNKYNKGALDHWMASKEVSGTGRAFDGVISPVSAYSACPHHSFEHVTYTSMWNITDQPAAVFPVTRVVEDDSRCDIEHRDEVERRIHDRYDPCEVVGAPVALQVITMRLEEEMALKLARVAATALGK